MLPEAFADWYACNVVVKFAKKARQDPILFKRV